MKRTYRESPLIVPVKVLAQSFRLWILLLALLVALPVPTLSSEARDLYGTTPVDPWDDRAEERQQCNVATMASTKTFKIAPDLSLTLLQDASQFLEGTEGDGTGTVIWGASICLAKYIHSDLRTMPGKVLELGSGVGLPSLVLAKNCQNSCRNRILATDSQEATLQQLKAVAKLNGLQEKLTATKFDWTDETESSSLIEQVDVLLASDVIYSRSMVEPLVQTIQRILSQSNGIAYLSFKNSRPGVKYFVEEAMPNAGFELVQEISCQNYLKDPDHDSSSRWEGDDHSIYKFERRQA